MIEAELAKVGFYPLFNSGFKLTGRDTFLDYPRFVAWPEIISAFISPAG